MSKKLIISESQLQKLMERKHSYRDNTPEGEVEEEVASGSELAIINNPEEETEEVSSEDKMVDVLKKAHTFIMNSQTEGSEELCSEIESILNELGSETNDEEEYKEIPGFEGTMDDLNNISVNESIESIKSNFKRFL